MSRIAKRLNLKALDTRMGLFDYTIRIVTGDYNNAQKYASHVYEIDKEGLSFEDLEGSENIAHGRCFLREGYVPIIWLPRYPKTPREIATLAHEAIHAVNHMFRWCSTQLSGDTEEVFAHAVSHVVNNILDKLER